VQRHGGDREAAITGHRRRAHAQRLRILDGDPDTGHIWHDHIVHLHGFVANQETNLLVYKYMHARFEPRQIAEELGNPYGEAVSEEV
jgi:hypothetical protein